MKLLCAYSAFLIIFATNAFAEKVDRFKEIEKEGLTIARALCVDKYECNILIKNYDEAENDPDPSGRYITFSALAIYIEQTLAPKLEQTDEVKGKLARMRQLFEERQGE